MIHLKPFEKNYTIELVQRLFRGLYAKGVQSRTTDNANAKDAGIIVFVVAFFLRTILAGKYFESVS